MFVSSSTLSTTFYLFAILALSGTTASLMTTAPLCDCPSSFFCPTLPQPLCLAAQTLLYATPATLSSTIAPLLTTAPYPWSSFCYSCPTVCHLLCFFTSAFLSATSLPSAYHSNLSASIAPPCLIHSHLCPSSPTFSLPCLLLNRCLQPQAIVYHLVQPQIHVPYPPLLPGTHPFCILPLPLTYFPDPSVSYLIL